MSLKHVLTATAAAAVLTVAGVSQAQQSAPRDNPAQPSSQTPSAAPSTAAPSSGGGLSRSMLHELNDDKAMVSTLNISAKDLADADIYGSDGKKIGEVNKVLGDSSNQAKAVTIDVGGFLGMGAREVIFPLDKLQKGTEAKRLQTSMTKQEIEKLDEWADNKNANEPRRSTGTPATPPAR
jgi:hypothetical protein